MISELRKKFILITMLSVLLVLAIILGAINISNYISVDRNLEERMDLLVKSGGSFLGFEKGGGPGRSGDMDNRDRDDNEGDDEDGFPGDKKDDPGFMGPMGKPDEFGEMPFDSRYFTVTFDASGTVSDKETDRIYSVSDEEAERMASAVYGGGSSSGYYGDFKYRLCEKDDGAMVIFLDGGRERSTARNFLYTTFIIAALALVGVLVLVVILSGIVMRPVAESYEKQKRFITDASHEIKTPLAIIEANNEVVEMENGESEWTKSISNQIRRLSSLTEKLVLLSRMDEAGYKQDMSEIELAALIRDMVASYDAVCESCGKAIDLDLTDGVVIRGNSENISRMLSLLIDNAIKYSSEGAHISISLRGRQSQGGRGRCHLVLSNPVDEIEAGDLDVLFERFYRSDQSRNSKTGGHGIGLSVVSAIVRSHKGRIHASSPDGKSIVFDIVF